MTIIFRIMRFIAVVILKIQFHISLIGSQIYRDILNIMIVIIISQKKYSSVASNKKCKFIATFKFLFGFMVGVGLTSILSTIVFHLIANMDNDKEKKLDNHRNISGLLQL